MKKPDLYPKIEWFEGMEVVRNSDFEKAKLYIDILESENKSLKENLQAIAGSTQDSEEPLTKCIHGIAVKHLNI